MNPEEQRLSDLLHRAAPEPPRRVTVEDVAFRLANTAGGTRSSRVRSPRTRRGFSLLSHGWAPALAAASVVVVAGLSAGAAVVLTSHHSPTPGSGNVVNTPPASPTQASTSAPPTQVPTSPPAGKGPVRIPGGPWAAELLNGGHQTLTLGSLVGSGNSLYAYTGADLVRLDPATGRILAQTPFSGAIPNPPVVVGSTVWTVWQYSGGNVVLRGFDATTLAEVKSVLVPAYGQVSSNAQGALTSGPDGRLYVAAGDTVAVVNPASGQIQRIQLLGGSASSVAVSPDGSKLYVGTGSFRLLIYNLASDTVEGSSTMSIGGYGGNLVATSGGVWGTIGVGMSEWVWFAPDGDLRFAHRESTGAGAGYDSLPSYSCGVVWIGGSHTLECASPVNGQALATTTIPPDNNVVQYFGSPTVTDGHAYAYYQDNNSQQTGLAQLTPPPACGLTTSPQGS
jgi:hypothetical protein